MNSDGLAVLLIPAVDVCHYQAAATGRQAPRMPAALGWMIDHLHAYAARATIGFFGETAARHPELAQAAEAAGCEAAAMTYDAVDPWALPPGALRDQIEATIATLDQAGVHRPTTFLPPFPAT